MKSIHRFLLRLRKRFFLIYTRDYIWVSRRRDAKRDLRNIGSHSLPLTPSEKEEILAFWEPYRSVRKELAWFEFYKASCEDLSVLKYYIPDSIYYPEIDMFFNHPRRCEALDDKNLYDLYFYYVEIPFTSIRIVHGDFFDRDYNLLTFEQALDICREAKTGVGKVTRCSFGGHGIKFFDFTSPTAEDELKEYLKHDEDIIIQEVIQQHPFFSNIHPESINTIRMMTLFLDGEVIVVSSILRMGTGKARVDNGSSGGISCAINPDGTLKENGRYTTGIKSNQHPNGTVFKGLKVVGYERCCETAKKLALRLFTSTRIISWDFAVGLDGEPILIELNLTYGGLSTHQLNKGPIFGDLTPLILSRVYASKKDYSYYKN